MFESFLLSHKSFCYLQSQSQSFSLENGFREQRYLESIWYSPAAVTKLKWLMFVFSMPGFFFELKKTTRIVNTKDMCDF